MKLLKLTKLFRPAAFGFIVVLSLFLSLLAFRGLPGEDGKPLRFQDYSDYHTFPTSPFEVTNSNSRYSLIESIVERHTLFFTDAQAKFSAPDIVYYQGRFFSIFTPGISFLAIPFYLLGKAINLTQFVTFQFNILVLLVNILLIVRLSQRFGVSIYAGLLGGLVYAFATNSLSYALSLSQHQFSAALVLLALLNASAPRRTLVNNLTLGILFSLGIIVDIPNLFTLLPMILYVAFRHFELLSHKLKVNLRLAALALGTLPLMVLFLWYNYTLTGSFTKLGQTIGRSDYPPKEEKIEANIWDNPYGYSRPVLPLGTRLQLNGFYQLLVSNERGWFYYSPVVALGLLGLYIGLKNPSTRNLSVLSFSTIFVTIVLYSMHGDPWGGWAFGSRYMIPSSAVSAAGLALAFSWYGRRLLFVLVFAVLTIYSVTVSSSGALTTTLIPPKVEAIYFTNPQLYTYQLNLDYIFTRSLTGSLAYHWFLKNYIDVKTFYFVFTGIALGMIASTYLLALKDP
jgi:hypothetical protein